MKLVRYGTNMLATVVIGFARSRFIASLPRCLERPPPSAVRSALETGPPIAAPYEDGGFSRRGADDECDRSRARARLCGCHGCMGLRGRSQSGPRTKPKHAEQCRRVHGPAPTAPRKRSERSQPRQHAGQAPHQANERPDRAATTRKRRTREIAARISSARRPADLV